MDFENLLERFAPFIRQYKIPLLIGLVGLGFIVFGLISTSQSKQEKADILAEGVSSQQVLDSEENKIAVDVEGAVINPGVYRLKKSAIIQDALIAAGGMSGTADREKVAKSINLASKVVDGGKIYIPSVGETPLRPFDSAQGSAGQEVAGDSTSGLININTATENELDSLSGVGPVTAGKIINNRPYGSIEELLSKKAVSRSVFEKIKDKISVY